MASTTSAGVGRSGSPMPSEMTSMPAARFSRTLRSSSANRYGGMRSRRLLGCMQLLQEFVGELPPVYRDGPTGQGHVQILVDLHLELPPVEAHRHRAVAAAQDVGDGGARGARAGGHGLPHPPLEDPRAHYPGRDLTGERHVGAVRKQLVVFDRGADLGESQLLEPLLHEDRALRVAN